VRGAGQGKPQGSLALPGQVDTALLEARAELADRLRAEREEIEGAIATRVYAIADPRETIDPAYLHGLRAALKAAIDFFLATIEHGEQRSPEIPTTLLAQARMAARNGIPLQTVLRRYLAGYSLLTELMLGLWEDMELLGATALRELLHGYSSVFDRLLEAVSDEHRREATSLLRSTEQRRADRVRRLLDGELIDAAELGYPLDSCHVGVIGAGHETAQTIRRLAAAFDKRLLSVEGEEGRTWAWLGSPRQIDPEGFARLIEHCEEIASPQATIAFGEPGAGPPGWRLTHRQAAAALPMADRLRAGVVRYADVGLLASVVQDPVLTESLRRLYLAPLGEERDGGEAMRQTLEAYFAADRNVTSAAAALGLSRQTVRSRLQAIEKRLGRLLDRCATEVDLALKVDGVAGSAKSS
jgi:hypothetical protein